MTNEDRTGTHLLLKLLLNSALQHSSSFDAKIQNLFSRATAKGNQFIYMEYVIKVNKVNTYTNSSSQYLSEAIELSQKIGCAFGNVRGVSSLRHFPPSVCLLFSENIFYCSFWRLRQTILRLHLNKGLIFFSWKYLTKNILESGKSFFNCHGKYTLVNIVSLGSRVAELGSLSSGAERAMKISIKRIFTIFVTNTSF